MRPRRSWMRIRARPLHRGAVLFLRQRLGQRQRAVAVLERLHVRELGECCVGRRDVGVDRLGRAPPAIEVVRELGGGRSLPRAGAPLEQLADARVKEHAAPAGDLVVERVLVEHVHELIAHGEVAARKLDLLDQAHQTVDAIELLEMVLEAQRIDLGDVTHRHRVEGLALHRGGDQQPALLLVERLELALDHRSHRGRNLAVELTHRPRQLPAVAVDQRAALDQVVQQVDHEQRRTAGLLVHPGAEVGRQAMTGELHGDVGSDVLRREEPQLELGRRAVAVELEQDRPQRMGARQQLLRAVGPHHQERQLADAPAEIGDQLGGGEVGPVQVLEHQADGQAATELDQRVDQLAPHALLTAADELFAGALGRDLRRGGGKEQRVPRRSAHLEHAAQQRAVTRGSESRHRFEEG